MQKSLETGYVPSHRIIAAIDDATGSEWPWHFPGNIYEDRSPIAPLERYWNPSDLKTVLARDGWIEFDLADKMLCTLALVELWRGPLEDIYLSANLSPVEEEVPDLTGAVDVVVCLRSECSNPIPIKAGRGRPRKYCSDRCKHMDRVKKAPIGGRRCAAPGCTNEFTPNLQWRAGQKQVYCSQACGQRARRKSTGRYGNRYDTCPNGHDRSEENVAFRKNGAIYCKACNREKQRAKYAADAAYRESRIKGAREYRSKQKEAERELLERLGEAA